MSLTLQISALTGRIAQELNTRITADHPALARAWLCLQERDGRVAVLACYNVQEVTRLSKGRYRVTWAIPMQDDQYLCLATGTPWYQTAPSIEAKTAQFVDVLGPSVFGFYPSRIAISLLVYR
ncbi:conserved hypothetical protein [Gammaproteobacteria bacterium]